MGVIIQDQEWDDWVIDIQDISKFSKSPSGRLPYKSIKAVLFKIVFGDPVNPIIIHMTLGILVMQFRYLGKRFGFLEKKKHN